MVREEEHPGQGEGQGQVQGQGQVPGQRRGQAPPPGGRRYRSLFWAIVLIGVGVVALLFNLDIISPASLGMLTYVWPILLIGLGVDLLFGRRSMVAGSLIGVATIGLIVVLMVIGPTLGWTGDTEIKTDEFEVPVAQSTSAQISLDTGGYSADIQALPESGDSDRPLLDASVAYRGAVEFESSEDDDKIVRLSAKGQRWWWPLLDLGDVRTWDIGLDRKVPLALLVGSSAGSVEVDLSVLQLTELRADMSSGDMHVLLPIGGSEALEAAFEMSSGELEVEAVAGTRVDMSLDMSSGDARVLLGDRSDATVTFDASSGRFTLSLAADQAFRVEVRSVSSGNIDLPSRLIERERGDGREGTWETEGYSGASHRVHLVIAHMSSGNVRVERAD